MYTMGVMYQVLTLVIAVTALFSSTAIGNTVVGKRDSVKLRETRDTSETERTCSRGVPGRDGRDGRDGVQGPYGPPGQKGEPGSFGLVDMEAMLVSLKAHLSVILENHSKSYGKKLEAMCQSLTRSVHDAVTTTVDEDTRDSRQKKTSNLAAGGAVYTRWGRTSCPDEAQKLYHGVVVGSHYTHDGSGANYLCLPLNPQWNRTVAGYQSGSYIYGTEFEIYESNTGFHRHNAGGKLQHDHDAQCSVCHTSGRQSHVMIPARLECPAGWTLEYIGFLMSAHHNHKRSEYVCVDQDPDVHAGTSESKNGALFYTTEVVCGSLLCPPYVDGFEITCVVCTR